jgi:porin
LVSFSRSGLPTGTRDPIQYAFLAGIGGKGVVPGRPDDSFGFGLARTQFSSSFVPFLRQQFNLGLQREDAIEMYYNAAITSWMNVTTDLQIIDSGLNKALSPTTRQLTSIDTVVVLGTHLRVRF